jgi:hypothetical protein
MEYLTSSTYKLNGRTRSMFNRNGKTFTKVYRDLIRQGALLPATSKFIHVPVNQGKRNEFIVKDSLLDKRSKIPKIKTKYQSMFEIIDNKVTIAKAKTFTNTVRYNVWEIRSRTINKTTTFEWLLSNSNAKAFYSKTPLRLNPNLVFHQKQAIYGSENQQTVNQQIGMIHEKFSGSTIIYHSEQDKLDYSFTNNPEFFKELLVDDSDHYKIIELTESTTTQIDRALTSLKDVKMYNCAFKIENPNISTMFEDAGNRRCVPEILFNYYTRTTLARPIKHTIEQIADQLNDEDDDKQYPRDERMLMGYDSNDIERFCKIHRLPMYALDIHDKVFHSYYPVKRNQNLPALCYYTANEHMYLCTDKTFINSINAKTRVTFTGKSVVASNVREGLEVLDTDTVVDTDNLLPQLIDYVKSTKRMVRPQNIQIKNGQVSRVVTDDGVLLANQHPDIVKQYIEQYNTMFKPEKALKFRNQSAIGFGCILFNTLYPHHIKTQMNRDVLGYLQVNAGIVQDYGTNTTDIDDCIGIDIRKCRTSCMRDNILGAFKRFTCVDTMMAFEETPIDLLRPGFYYTLTDNFLPARGNAWYSDGFLQYLQSEGIAFTIKYQLISSYTYPHEYFRKYFDNVTTYPDFKLMSNSFIGTLATTHRTISKMWFEQSIDACGHYYFQTKDNVHGKFQSSNDVSIHPIEEDGKTLFYQCEQKIRHSMVENDIPLYNQLLENEWIKVYELRKRMGGDLIAIKTDNVIVQYPDGEGVDTCSVVIGGYQEGDIKQVREIMERTNDELVMEVQGWNFVNQEDLGDFDDIANTMLDTNKCFMIHGEAGTGKSYLIRNIQEKIEARGLKQQTLAFTNKASNAIGGCTIHKFLAINGEGKMANKHVSRLKSCDYIIVDEISMVSTQILTMFQLCKQQNPKVKFILAGHYWQLPPIGEEHLDFENAFVTKWLCDFNRLELTVNQRSDDVMRDIGRYAYNNCAIKKEHKDLMGTFNPWSAERHLSYTNRTRVMVNDRMMESLACDSLALTVDDKQLAINERAQDVKLCIGAPVLAIINKKYNDYQVFNNCEFTVSEWDEAHVYLTDEEGVLLPVEHCHFHEMFVVAYCTTVHKSQGCTYDFEYCIWEAHKFTKNMLYVAVTRATDAKLITFGNARDSIPVKVYTDTYIKTKIAGYTQQDAKKNRMTSLSVTGILEIVKAEKNACFACAKKLDETAFTLDRINNQLGHTLENVRVCCLSCNRKKIHSA